MIYLIGSLRNPKVPEVGNVLRASGYEVFDDWFSAGPEADDKWQAYEQGRGRSYVEGLAGAAAGNVYRFDRRFLDSCNSAVLVLPAGKSAHLELGFVIGQGKSGFILLDGEPKRWDVMYQFATVVQDLPDLLLRLKDTQTKDQPTERFWTYSGSRAETGAASAWQESSPPGGEIQVMRPLFSRT